MNAASLRGLVLCLLILMQLWVLGVDNVCYPPSESAGGWRSVASANTTPNPAQKEAILRNTGLDWDQLHEAWKYCDSFGGPHSVVVIRRGWIAAEWRNYEDARGIASCTKSLTGLAMAKLFDLNDSRLST